MSDYLIGYKTMYEMFKFVASNYFDSNKTTSFATSLPFLKALTNQLLNPNATSPTRSQFMHYPFLKFETPSGRIDEFLSNITKHTPTVFPRVAISFEWAYEEQGIIKVPLFLRSQYNGTTIYRPIMGQSSNNHSIVLKKADGHKCYTVSSRATANTISWNWTGDLKNALGAIFNNSGTHNFAYVIVGAINSAYTNRRGFISIRDCIQMPGWTSGSGNFYNSTISSPISNTMVSIQGKNTLKYLAYERVRMQQGNTYEMFTAFNAAGTGSGTPGLYSRSGDFLYTPIRTADTAISFRIGASQESSGYELCPDDLMQAVYIFDLAENTPLDINTFINKVYG